MVTPIFLIAIHVFVFKMHSTLKIFQNKITGTCFYLKKHDIPLELAPVLPFYHTNTYNFFKNLCKIQGNVKGHVIKKKAWIFMLIFISYHKMILYARN